MQSPSEGALFSNPSNANIGNPTNIGIASGTLTLGVDTSGS